MCKENKKKTFAYTNLLTNEIENKRQNIWTLLYKQYLIFYCIAII